MNDRPCNNKFYSKSKKCYFPCRTALKIQPKKRKKKNKWIKLESSFKSCKSEKKTLDLIINDTFKEEGVHETECSTQASQETENSLRLSPILKYSNFNRKSPIIRNKISNRKLTQGNTSSASELLVIESDEESVVSCVIDEFLTQDCSTVEQYSVKANLRYTTPAKCKKSFDVNGLAYNLQSALSKQNADLSYWKYKREFVEDTSEEDSSPLLVQVKNSYKQFGVNVLECEDLNKAEDCLLMVGFTRADHFCGNVNGKIKIYQPYLTKHIKYKDSFMCCYFNISKLINL